MDKHVEFLHALSIALIDAIPLSVLSKLRNFLWLGSTEGRFIYEALESLLAHYDANVQTRRQVTLLVSAQRVRQNTARSFCVSRSQP